MQVRIGLSAFLVSEEYENYFQSDIKFQHVIMVYTGVSKKIWSVLLQNDGLEENNEVFRIILNKPKNAVLGHRKELAVEIIDPRAGKISLFYLKYTFQNYLFRPCSSGILDCQVP